MATAPTAAIPDPAPPRRMSRTAAWASAQGENRPPSAPCGPQDRVHRPLGPTEGPRGLVLAPDASLGLLGAFLGLLTASARGSMPPTTSACKRGSPGPFDPRSRTRCPGGEVAPPDPLSGFEATAVRECPLHPPASLARCSVGHGDVHATSPTHGQQALQIGRAHV